MRNARHDWIANGRFKGGHITRHYGDPAHGIDAVQLEISQRCYMDEATFAYDEAKAMQLGALLLKMLQAPACRGERKGRPQPPFQ